MPMSPRERKAAFKSAVELKGTTCAAAARDAIGVTWYHLSEGLQDERPLSREVQEKFAAYIGKPVGKVFAAKRETAAA